MGSDAHASWSEDTVLNRWWMARASRSRVAAKLTIMAVVTSVGMVFVPGSASAHAHHRCDDVFRDGIRCRVISWSDEDRWGRGIEVYRGSSVEVGFVDAAVRPRQGGHELRICDARTDGVTIAMRMYGTAQGTLEYEGPANGQEDCVRHTIYYSWTSFAAAVYGLPSGDHSTQGVARPAVGSP